MATTRTIIEAKVRRPAPHGLDRPRLSTPLQTAAGPDVVVVLAPPGSGKTTLLALAADGVPVAAWCTAGPEDRSGRGFLDHLTRSLSVALGCDLGRPTEVDDLVDALQVPLRRLPEAGAALLVVDDVHELTGSVAEGQLAAMLRWRPKGLRVALGTRRPLGFDALRLQLTDDLLVLDADALRFRSWEVEELFRLVYGQPLLPEAAAALTRRTGGWAAGLKLFQLATSGKPATAREHAVTQLGGRSRLLRSYLTRTVLGELDPATRAFLVETSTLGTLTGPLCDTLLGRSGSAAVLEELTARQFFTTAAEDGRSYRYHQVLQTLLEGVLVDEYGAEQARRVYARSARLLEEEGLVSDAARAYALAEDQASVARLVQRTDPGVALAGPDTDAGADDPWLLLACARRQHRRGAVAAAVATYRRAETLIDDVDLRCRCAEERLRAALWLPDGADQRRPASHLDTWEEAVRRATVQVARAEDEAVPSLGRAVALLLWGRPEDSRAALASRRGGTVTEELVADLVAIALDTLDALHAVPATDGIATDDSLDHHQRMLGRLEQVVLGADVADRPWLARVARGAQCSLLLLLAEDADWRVQSCASLFEEYRRDGDPWAALVVSALLGGVLAARGDARATTWLQEAASLANLLRAPVLVRGAELLDAVHRTRSGEAGSSVALARARARTRAVGLVDLEPVLNRVAAARTRSARGGRRPDCSVRVRCLGGLAVEVDGNAVPLPEMRPLPRALLAILALHAGHEVHREVLMSWLWPDAPMEAAAHRLHTAASTARRHLADAGLPGAEVQRRGNAYRLVVPEASFDVAELEAALRRAARCEAEGDLDGARTWSKAACDLYIDDLLPEAGPEEWVVDERQRLRTAAASAAYAVGELTLRAGAPAEALPAARRAVDLDPLRDSAWALLAEIQEAMGDFSAAAATRQAHARVQDRVCEGLVSVTLQRPPPPGAPRAPA